VPRRAVKSTRNVGDAPAALAIDDASLTLVSWSQMGRTLSVVGIGDAAAPLETARASGGALSAAVARGRRLFHAVDGRTASDGRACASCHTDGRDDGFVWNTPEGPRQTPMLAGRLDGTAPYGWTRDAKTFHDYVRGTAQRLRGRGFTNEELDDLSAYVSSLKAPPHASADAALVKRGSEVFASSGCAACHKGSATTDNARHSVAQATGTFATPSLRFVGGTAPYFHDGRYATLRALLTSNDPNMGTGKNLPAADLDALETYLRSL
jgi:mono/diheme cytochrome c family protein